MENKESKENMIDLEEGVFRFKYTEKLPSESQYKEERSSAIEGRFVRTADGSQEDIEQNAKDEDSLNEEYYIGLKSCRGSFISKVGATKKNTFDPEKDFPDDLKNIRNNFVGAKLSINAEMVKIHGEMKELETLFPVSKSVNAGNTQSGKGTKCSSCIGQGSKWLSSSSFRSCCWGFQYTCIPIFSDAVVYSMAFGLTFATFFPEVSDGNFVKSYKLTFILSVLTIFLYSFTVGFLKYIYKPINDSTKQLKSNFFRGLNVPVEEHYIGSRYLWVSMRVLLVCSLIATLAVAVAGAYYSMSFRASSKGASLMNSIEVVRFCLLIVIGLYCIIRIIRELCLGFNFSSDGKPIADLYAYKLNCVNPKLLIYMKKKTCIKKEIECIYLKTIKYEPDDGIILLHAFKIEAKQESVHYFFGNLVYLGTTITHIARIIQWLFETHQYEEAQVWADRLIKLKDERTGASKFKTRKTQLKQIQEMIDLLSTNTHLQSYLHRYFKEEKEAVLLSLKRCKADMQMLLGEYLEAGRDYYAVLKSLEEKLTVSDGVPESDSWIFAQIFNNLCVIYNKIDSRFLELYAEPMERMSKTSFELIASMVNINSEDMVRAITCYVYRAGNLDMKKYLLNLTEYRKRKYLKENSEVSINKKSTPGLSEQESIDLELYIAMSHEILGHEYFSSYTNNYLIRSLNHHKMALESRLKVFPETDRYDIADSYQNLSYVQWKYAKVNLNHEEDDYFNTNKLYKEAQENAEKALQMLGRLLNDECEEKLVTLEYLDDNNKMKTVFKGVSSLRAMNYMYSLAGLFYEKESYEQAEIVAKKAKNIVTEKGYFHKQAKVKCKIRLGRVLLKLEKFEDAKECFGDALEDCKGLLKDIKEEDHFDNLDSCINTKKLIFRTNLGYAKALIGLHPPKKKMALKYYDKAIRFQRITNGYFTERAKTKQEYSKLSNEVNEIAEFEDDFEEDKVLQNIEHHPHLANAYAKRAEAQFLKAEGCKEELKKRLNIYEHALSLINCSINLFGMVESEPGDDIPTKHAEAEMKKIKAKIVEIKEKMEKEEMDGK